ncbi:MAG: YdcF family protein [Acidovorax sp.]|nr:YdcF family protein [Acidovorax sp.]
MLVGGLLLADALALLGKGFFMVGVTVPAVLGLALCALGARWHSVRTWLHGKRWGTFAWRGCWLLLAAWVVSVAAFWAWLAQQVRGFEGAATAAPVQAIVVLGSGTPNGQPSPALRARLDKARELAATHPQAWVVVSGGVDFGETLSEGQVMGNYLREQGMDPARILQEERSTSTELNLQYSLPLLQQRGLGLNAAVAVVTSDFHTVRAQRIARKIGYTRAIPVPAPTPLYIRYNAWLREYFAMASSWVLREV